MTTLDANLERGFTVNCKRDNFNFESFYGPKTHLTESGTQPDLIRVWAGFFFVEDNSDNLGEKNVAIESLKPVDDGGILGEVRRRPCWSLGQSPSSQNGEIPSFTSLERKYSL